MFFSVGYTLPFDRPGVIFSLSQVKNILAKRGIAPLQTPKQKGAHSPSGNPLMYFLVGGRAEKVVTFLNNISQTKTSVLGLNKASFHHLRQQKEGENGVKRRVYRVIG
jgi:hypothetical protein